ncbi:MAG: cupin domain-containing protein [Pigmentiphaga sp.]
MPDYSRIIKALSAQHLQPLWDRYMTITSREPRSTTAAHVWSWSDLQHFSDRAVRDVSMDDAERRVLLMANPAFNGAIATTNTLLGGIQILQPGERASPHRHTIAALRFVMSADSGAATLVNGRVCPMEKGDLILTPSWSWHEHLNQSTQPVIWFDGLDVPLVQHLDAMFLEFETEAPPDALNAAYSASDGALDNPFHYAWKDTIKQLDRLDQREDGSKLLRYTDKINSGAVLNTIDCYALQLAADKPTRPTRTTATAIAVVVEGSGTTDVGGEPLHWSSGDVFTLPNWKWISHHAETDARLFLMTDRALLDKTGYLREESAFELSSPGEAQ